MLNTWDNVRINTGDRNHCPHDKIGLSYDSEDLSGWGQGQDRGRFGRGGRGQGQHNRRGDRNNNRNNSGETINVEELFNGENNILELDSNNETNYNSAHYFSLSSQLYNIINAQHLQQNMFGTIIIDSASTSDIVANKRILHDIHNVKNPLRVASLGGVTSIKTKSRLGK